MSSPLDDPPTIQQPPTYHAAEWGFASLFVSGVFGVFALLTLQICTMLFFGQPIWARGDLRTIFFVSIGAAVLVVAMIFASLGFGIISLISALRQRQSCALAIAGLLMSVFVLFLWIFVFIDLFSVLDFLMRRQGHGGIF